MAGTGIHPYHQQWPPAPAHPPVSAAPPPPPPPHTHPPPIPIDNPAGRPPSDEVRTIFISGLPEDVKERELQNLLRWLPGYEASQVNFKGEHPMGFALFATSQHALAAKDTLQNMVFDADLKSVLHTEMAKKNLFVKRGIVADSNAYDQSKRMRTGGDYTHTAYSTSPFHPPPAPVWGPHGYMAPPPPHYDPYAGYPVPPVPMPAPAPVPAPSSYVPVQNTKDNPPCNTLFIGNLGENINEEELRGLFITYIFKESVREKEGFDLPSRCPRCEWSSAFNDLPVAGRGCILLLMPQALHDRMHHAAVACIHSSSSHRN
ncbi:RNA binding protein (contains RRM repeats) [Handroanthus impetiginosus]|uniref:RNA binding protein (Contains RRM repeats) n=1 Tax=Handroanthus impetiginosus TaxID=429701 RepID=A0A2G9H2R8_9LAMI|nr:RNA binding protein (contains RRM repeats) [Handroanthus impetiginosus]